MVTDPPSQGEPGRTVDVDTGNPEPATVAEPFETEKELVASVGTVTVDSR